MSAITVARTTRSELCRRPGVGCRSCQTRSIHDARLAAMSLPHNRDGCCSDAEQLWVGIVNMHADGEPRGEMHPVKRALDIRQATGDLAVFGEDPVTDALYMASKSAVRVS